MKVPRKKAQIKVANRLRSVDAQSQVGLFSTFVSKVPRKKAQIKMAETIGVLVVFFFLLVFGFAFYFNMQKSSIETQKRTNTDLRSIEVAERASFLPELQCSRKNIVNENCFDLRKIDIFNSLLDRGDVFEMYFLEFGYSDIIVNEIYPGEGSRVIYSNPLPDYDFNLTSQFPVSLYYPETGKYSMGVLEVYVYE